MDPRFLRAVALASAVVACSARASNGPVPTPVDGAPPALDAVDATATDAPAMDAVSTDAPAMDVVSADATLADVAPADVPVDAGPCRSGRDCPGGVCNPATNACAQCASGRDCSGATPVCLGGRCVAGTGCTTSRNCPGQVCSTTLQRCVDCNVNDDCPMTWRCEAGSCLPPPRACRSTRDCTPFDQVCDAANSICVECLADVDCGAGSYCTASRTCARQVCTPGQRRCPDLRRAQTCNAQGSAWDESPCATGTSCAGGACATQVCAPGAYSCASATARQQCNVDGLGYTPSPCPAAPNATGACSAGACGIACNAGYADCDGSAANGCEVTLATSVSHCGACNNRCPTPANGSAVCAAGRCGVSACAAGFGDCDGSASNGCETNTGTSATHCGACGYACPARANASATCAAGSCGVACLPGFADCDGNPANGCEVDTRASASHCGACNRACALANASAACAASACVVAACNAGYGDCDGNPANGCETSTATAAAHCGACNRACAPPNATGACAAGTCGVGACAAGYANCDGNAANGCETNTGSSATSCGSCGRVCPTPPGATPACASGACTFACVAGRANCDGAPANGCETDTASSTTSCGGCRTVCAAGQFCASGVCRSPVAIQAMNGARHYHTGATAPDGRVWVFGGLGPNNGGPIASVEVLDPVTGVWTTRAPMPFANDVGAAAALRDGRLLYIGGDQVNGGRRAVAETYRYDPATNGWTRVASMGRYRYYFTAATALDGRVFAFGGATTVASDATCEVYDPVADTWNPSASMSIGRNKHVALTAPDGRIWVLGGWTPSGTTARVEIYTPTTNTWVEGPAMPSPRMDMGAAIDSLGRIWVYGGERDQYLPSTTAAVYDPVTQRWTEFSALAPARGNLSGAALPDGRLIAIGGSPGITTVHTYNPVTGLWQ